MATSKTRKGMVPSYIELPYMAHTPCLDGSDDHFSWVIAMFSIEKCRVSPFKKM